MKALENASLKNLNSFSVEASAKLLLTIETEEDLLSLPVFDRKKDFVLGGGSNVLFVTGIPGTAFLNRIAGQYAYQQRSSAGRLLAAAGEHLRLDRIRRARWRLVQIIDDIEFCCLNVRADGEREVDESRTATDKRADCGESRGASQHVLLRFDDRRLHLLGSG